MHEERQMSVKVHRDRHLHTSSTTVVGLLSHGVGHQNVTSLKAEHKNPK